MNMAIWKKIDGVNLKKITFWAHQTPDVYDEPKKFLNYITNKYQEKARKYNPQYLFEYLCSKKIFGTLFGQYTKSEVMARLHKAHGVPYFIKVNEFIANPSYGHKLLANTLKAFLDGNRYFAKFYDPLTHNLPAIKHFIMDFVIAYRKPYYIKITKGSNNKKRVYVLQSEESTLSKDLVVQSKKKPIITKNDLGVGMLCWHSVSNWHETGMKVIYSKPPNPPPPPLLLLSKKSKKRKQKNKLSKTQRMRKKINTGFS